MTEREKLNISIREIRQKKNYPICKIEIVAK